jgi:hypothetical protein
MQLMRRYAIGLVEEAKVAVVPISGGLFAEIVSGRACEANVRGERNQEAGRKTNKVMIF